MSGAPGNGGSRVGLALEPAWVGDLGTEGVHSHYHLSPQVMSPRLWVKAAPLGPGAT